jgi:hypothetical protein
MRAAVVLGFSVVGLLAACGQSGVTIDSSQGNFCEQIADVACNNMYQCCTEGEIESKLHVTEPRTEDECRTDFKRSCDRSAAQVNDSLKAGRMKFVADNLNKCLESIVAPSDKCSEVVTTAPWVDACMDSAFVGTVATDGACLFANDCAGGQDSYCAPNQKCAARPTGGFPCGTGCASAFYCSSGICTAKLAAGAMCTSSTACQKDLFCDTSQTMPVCAAKQPGGATCTSSAACMSGTCIPGTCSGTTSTSCFKDMDCGSRCGGTGFSCTQSSQCSTGTCQIGGFSCTSETTCTNSNPSDHCIFPILCVPATCVGTPVCTAETTTIDYCSGALSQLPVP